MDKLQIIDCNDKEINFNEVEVDIEYMYRFNSENYFITLSKKNGEYVGYIQVATKYGSLYKLSLLDKPVKELTDEVKETLVRECIKELLMITVEDRIKMALNKSNKTL